MVINLIAYSQGANSSIVRSIIDSNIFSKIFCEFNVPEVAKLNPCDLIDKYWSLVGGIRRQTKFFHIIMLARKRIQESDIVIDLLNNTKIPERLNNQEDIIRFWRGFDELQTIFRET